MIQLAKLNEKHLTDITQVLYYGEMENNPNLKLLELNGPLLKSIEEGQVLAFKGCFISRVNFFSTNLFIYSQFYLTKLCQ